MSDVDALSETSGGGVGELPRVIADLAVVAHLDESQIDAISRILRDFSGMLTGGDLEQMVAPHVGEDAAPAIARVLFNLGPAEKLTALQNLIQWRSDNPEAAESFPEDIVNRLRCHLDVLIQNYPSLKIMRKVERLTRDTGNELGNSLFVCDLRPVYDDAHTPILGCVPLVTLRIRYLKQNGDLDTFELTLTERDLEDLMEHAADARKKLNILKTSVVAAGTRNE